MDDRTKHILKQAQAPTSRKTIISILMKDITYTSKEEKKTDQKTNQKTNQSNYPVISFRRENNVAQRWKPNLEQ